MPPRAKQPSAARSGRAGRAARKAVEIEWFIRNVSDKVKLTMRKRVRITTEFLKAKVVKNISRPVTKGGTGPRGGKIVTDRSKPSEFPKADTTQLMKTIFGEVRQVSPGVFDGFVGTPLDYGLILETNKRLDRSFLKRTFDEERSTVTRILTGPIK